MESLLLIDCGKCVCHIGEAMDKAGISISKMGRLTGLNYDVVKKYYTDQSIRIDKDVFSRIAYVLSVYGIDVSNLFAYVKKKKWCLKF